MGKNNARKRPVFLLRQAQVARTSRPPPPSCMPTSTTAESMSSTGNYSANKARNVSCCGVSRPLPVSRSTVLIALLQVSTPQVVDMGRQIEGVQLAADFIEIQAADILRPPVQESLTQKPALLERVGSVDLLGGSEDVAGDICGHVRSPGGDYCTGECTRSHTPYILHPSSL